jgi:HTH-type transcriptional regulator/antitoxin MqsA
LCGAADLVEATEERHFHPRGKQVVVTLLISRCPACSAELTNHLQHRENLVRLKARKSEYGEVLLGEEIVGLRKRYGLTQDMAAKIFGKGKIAFSRYENEVSYPDASTTKLLALAIQSPEALKMLADAAGVAIPLWDVRQAEREADRAASSGTRRPAAVAAEDAPACR